MNVSYDDDTVYQHYIEYFQNIHVNINANDDVYQNYINTKTPKTKLSIF